MAVAVLIPFLAGCASDHNSVSGPGYGTMNVRLTDDPGDYDQVNIVVTQISARLEDGAVFDTTGAESLEVEDGWVILDNTTHTYDLMTLQNGVTRQVANELVPAGRYTQIRMKIGTGSNVVIDGVTHPLTVPSGAQSGWKINGIFDVPTNGGMSITLDFDAARSIVTTGNGDYILKPVIRAMPTPLSGAISGSLSPATPATIEAIAGPDTLSSARASGTGGFTLSVLPAGAYNVTVRPDSGYRDTTFTDVLVTAGATHDLGTIGLTPVQ
jgi:hypothetical protein